MDGVRWTAGFWLEVVMIRIFTLVLAIICLFSSAFAQTRGANSNPTRNPKSAKDVEAERILKERRANAQSLLINLAADARNFKDQALRARTQARIANALWESDRERARVMFRAAWDAAETADKEGQERLQEDIRQTKAKTGGQSYAVATPPEIRSEVLRLAAKHDRSLGEEFLGKLKEQREQEVTDQRNRNPFGTNEAISQRLGLAQQLLEIGDTERAMQFADPVLGDVSMSSIDFLCYLREKDAAAADQRYAAMLAAAPANPRSDANTVSLLSSYIFTPHLYIVFQGSGVSSSQTSRPLGPVDVAPGLRAAFFQTAANILLRPLAAPGQDQTTAGHDGQYLVITRLMPVFEQYAPQEMTTALRAQLEALASVASNNARRDNEWVHRGLGPEKPAADREQTLVDRIERAKTSAQRDQLNLELAMYLAGKGETRARDYVDKIDETEMRKSARAYIDAALASRAIEKKDTERALEIARTGDLTHVQRTWLLTQTAKLLAKTDRDKALELLDDATTEARRIGGSDADRPRAFLAVSNSMFLIDKAAAWDATGEAIKAANSAENFTGEDGQLTFRMITKGINSVYQNSVAEFDVAPLFEKLAADNYERAVDLAGGFTREAPRANAVIAIAHSVLREKKK
jgi:hypothetical protein